MAERALGYRRLERELWKRAIGHSFLKGQGGVVAFVWAIGAGVLSVVYGMPELAAALTGVTVALEAVMARGYLRGPESRAQIVRAALARHLDPGKLGDERLRAACARSTDLFVELVSKVAELGDAKAARDDLQHVLDAACEMLVLQHDAARRVEEYTRILRLLEQGGASRGAEPGVAALRAENQRTLEKLAAEERQLVGDVGARLETALLQVVQVSRDAADVVRTRELAQDADEKLHDLQAVVEARREAADLIRRTLATS